MMGGEQMVTELLPCGYCKETGLARHWLLFRRPCYYCTGTGERKFMYDERIPADIIQRLRRESIAASWQRRPNVFDQFASLLFG